MFFETLGLSLILIFLFYKWISKDANYFKDKNIKHDKFRPFVGSFKDLVLGKKSMRDTVIGLYKKYEGERIVGIYDNNTAAYFIRDPELVKQITVKEFDHFVNHKVSKNKNGGLFGLSVFSMKDQKWKDMRATLTPAYTGCKLRAMFEFIKETSEEYVTYLKGSVREGLKDLDLKDFYTRYANDVIATTAFGFQMNSLKEDDHIFFEMGKGVSNFGKCALVKFIIMIQFQRLSRFLRISLLSKKHTTYYRKLVLDMMKKRFEQKIFRPDMINMLMEARGMDVLGNSDCKPNKKWTDEEIVAQSLLFFFSGFESVSSVLCFISQELMENHEVQEKLKAEIQEVLKELNGEQLTYEALNGLKYMDCVISEALRKWPINSLTDRVCTKTIEIQDPETGEVIELQKGDKITIPIVGLHRDPKYFPDPMKFDPERFNEENKHNIVPNTYIPFGIGPRMCIANRFAFMEIKTMLFYMFADLKVEVSEKSSIPLEMDPYSTQPHVKNGFWVRILEDNP